VEVLACVVPPPCLSSSLPPSARRWSACSASIRLPSTSCYARIVVAAAAGCGNTQIARDEGVTLDTVRLRRRRWVLLQAIALDDLRAAERVADAPRCGTPVRITDTQVCQIVALACEAPARSGRPISHWTGREVADEVMRRGIADQISARHAARLLQRGRGSRTAGASGSPPPPPSRRRAATLAPSTGTGRPAPVRARVSCAPTH